MCLIQTLQSKYLAQLIHDQKPVTLHFKNGHRRNGLLMSMTDEVIFFKHGITDYIYKNSIHAVMPISQHTTKV